MLPRAGRPVGRAGWQAPRVCPQILGRWPVSKACSSAQLCPPRSVSPTGEGALKRRGPPPDVCVWTAESCVWPAEGRARRSARSPQHPPHTAVRARASMGWCLLPGDRGTLVFFAHIQPSLLTWDVSTGESCHPGEFYRGLRPRGQSLGLVDGSPSRPPPQGAWHGASRGAALRRD